NTSSITVSSGAFFAVNRSDSVSQSTSFNKAISGAGGFQQAGTGTTTLTLANTYLGVTTVQGGVLRYGIANAISTGDVTITSGAALDLATFNDSVGAVTLTSGTILGSGTLTSTSGFTLTSGSIQAPLAGSVGLTMQGSGRVPLSGANLYTGATTVSSGTLQMGNGSTAGSIGSSSSVAVSTNAIFAVNRSDNVTQGSSFFPAISGGGGFQQAGSGTTTLAAINTYTGPTSVLGGALAITGTLAATPITVSTAAILGGSGTTAGSVTFGAGSKFLFNFAAALPLNVGGNVTFSDPSTFGVDDIIGLDSSVAEGTYTLIAGNVNVTGLANLGSSNAYNLGSGKSAYFQQGSLQIVVVPEPTLASVGAITAAGMILLARRKSRRDG
ncbi:MAG: autotransporter-associated beta strand repeat-containing protein, partial [Planctomycetaceae bacterium]